MRTLEPTAIANAARELLNQGDAVGAERVLTPVFNALKGDASARHLMGMIAKANGDLDAAEQHLRAAVAFSLNEGAYYNDLGLVLMAKGAHAEALKLLRAALALLPAAGGIRVNIAQCLIDSGDLAAAEREARAYVAAQPGPDAWTLLARVLRGQERHEEALAASAAALQLAPQKRGLRYNHAKALDRAGRAKEALGEYEALARQQLDTPELALALARALYANGRKNDAEAVALEGVKRWPGSTSLHGTLARMRLLRGEGENAAALMEAEVAKRPDDAALQLACIDVLHQSEQPQRALNVAEQALARWPDAPALLTAYGVALDECDRPHDALRALRRVATLTNDAALARRNMLSTLLRAGLADEALAMCRALRAEDPFEQYLLACESTALRMLGDPLYKELCDYDRLIVSYDIPAPQGFFTVESFNTTVAGVLRAQHYNNAHPLDQSTPHCSQTARNLLLEADHNLKVFMAACDQAVRDYIRRLNAERDHPVDRRRNRHYRYGGLRSTRLDTSGRLPNHVHDRGWISSAYVAALTPIERPRDPRSGWLAFGEPNRPPQGCGPECMIEPKVGRLVLFPSYFWHGVTRFEGAERLSAAFDVLPG